MIKMNTLTGGNSASSHLPHSFKNKKSKSEINFAKKFHLKFEIKKHIFFFRMLEKNHIIKILFNYPNS